MKKPINVASVYSPMGYLELLAVPGTILSKDTNDVIVKDGAVANWEYVNFLEEGDM